MAASSEVRTLASSTGLQLAILAGASVSVFRFNFAATEFGPICQSRCSLNFGFRPLRRPSLNKLRTYQFDPLRPFEIGLVKVREAPESGLWLKPQRANRRSRRWPVCRCPSIPSLGDGVMLGTAWIDRPVDTQGPRSLLPRPFRAAWRCSHAHAICDR